MAFAGDSGSAAAVMRARKRSKKAKKGVAVSRAAALAYNGMTADVAAE